MGPWELLKTYREQNPAVHYISFSRNFGKEAALYAGLQYATGDLVVVMDADLQDPPSMLLEMKTLLDQNFARKKYNELPDFAPDRSLRVPRSHHLIHRRQRHTRFLFPNLEVKLPKPDKKEEVLPLRLNRGQ